MRIKKSVFLEQKQYQGSGLEFDANGPRNGYNDNVLEKFVTNQDFHQKLSNKINIKDYKM